MRVESIIPAAMVIERQPQLRSGSEANKNSTGEENSLLSNDTVGVRIVPNVLGNTTIVNICGCLVYVGKTEDVREPVNEAQRKSK